MNLSQQRRVIVTSSLVVIAVGVMAGYERGTELPTARFMVGVGMAYTICSIMVDLGSPMGAGFAGLILISSLIYNGEDAFKLLRKRSGPAPKGKRDGGRKVVRATSRVGAQAGVTTASVLQGIDNLNQG